MSCIVAQRKGYRPWFWPLSLGPVGAMVILLKTPLARATTPEMREAWDQRADWTGGILSAMTFLFMSAAALAMLFGISVSPTVPAGRMTLTAASVDGVTVKLEREGSSSVNSSSSPFADGDRKGTRYTNVWLNRSGGTVGQCIVEIADNELRVDGKDFGSIAKGDTVEIDGQRIVVNGKPREAMPSSARKTRAPMPEKADASTLMASHAEVEQPTSALETFNEATKKLSRDEKTGALNVSFTDLDLQSILNGHSMVENDLKRLPQFVKALVGKKIKIRGHMCPTYEETGIDSFVLDRTTRLLNFGADPKIYDLIQVHLKKGTTIDLVSYSQAFDVIGVFEIDLLVEDGKPFGLYSLKNAEVVGYKKTH